MKAEQPGHVQDTRDEASPSVESVTKELGRLSQVLSLAGLRVRTERTQAQIADEIGTSQSGVSRLERQHDVLVSTLRDYVSATGGRLHLVASYPDFACGIHLPILDEKTEPRSFRVVWQNVHNRQFVHVGWLEFTGTEFTFKYSPEAEIDSDFEPFPTFPDYRRTYRSAELFSFFADRLVSSARTDYSSLVAALGLTSEDATPVELLARSWGANAHDTIQIVPEPVNSLDGEVRSFLASGVRHVAEDDPTSVDERIARLQHHQELDLRDDTDNPRNTRAIVLEANGLPVGWVPDYLLEYIHKQREAGRRISVAVERANGPEVSWHLRLLCRCLVTTQVHDP